MAIHRSKSQKDINIATRGIENIIPNIGQKEKEIGIEFGRQTVEGVTDNTKNAQKAIEHILEGDIVREEELRALVIKNNTVTSQMDERSEQGGVIVRNVQPEDLSIDEKQDSITTPKANVEKVSGTVEEFAEAFGFSMGRDMLGRTSVINEGRAIPIGKELLEGRKIVIEEFEKLMGIKLISDEPSGSPIIESGESASSI